MSPSLVVGVCLFVIGQIVGDFTMTKVKTNTGGPDKSDIYWFAATCFAYGIAFAGFVIGILSLFGLG